MWCFLFVYFYHKILELQDYLTDLTQSKTTLSAFFIVGRNIEENAKLLKMYIKFKLKITHGFNNQVTTQSCKNPLSIISLYENSVVAC